MVKNLRVAGQKRESLLNPCLLTQFADFGQKPAILVARAETAL